MSEEKKEQVTTVALPHAVFSGFCRGNVGGFCTVINPTIPGQIVRCAENVCIVWRIAQEQTLAAEKARAQEQGQGQEKAA